MAADDVPLTPMVVDCVTFDRASLGRRGYNEDQVDDFLDRVQATLSGADSLTAHEVQNAMFDSAPLIRRGYHEDQVDEFLDLVVEELTRREGAVNPAVATQPTPPPAAAVSHAPTHYRPVPPPTAAEQTNPMLFAQPPSMQSPNTQPLKQKPRHAPAETAAQPEAAPDVAPQETPETPETSQDVDSWRDSDVLALPLPPAPPTERGYRPGDVERLVKLLAEAADTNPDELAKLKLSRTFFIGQGYHAGSVDAVRDAWVRELQRRAL